jgi:peptidoglycan/LPS O-acetylase OafA/YrhL
MKYIPQLDGIRFFAIVSVIIGHWVVWDTTDPFIKGFPWGRGVILFFVLSGYLISTILFNLKDKIGSNEITVQKSILNFYARRILRIFPIYFLTLIFLKSIQFQNINEAYVWLLSFTSNIYQAVKGQELGKFVHYWSLAVEEQFYLVWPFIIFFVSRKYLLRTILLVMLGSVLSRIICCIVFKDNWMIGAYFSLNLAMPLSLGGLIAYYQIYKPELYSRTFGNKTFFYLSGLIYFLYYYLVRSSGIKFLLPITDEYFFAIFSAFFIGNAAISNFKFLGKVILENKIVLYLGSISYGLYIYHMFIGNLYWDYLAIELDLHTSSKYTCWMLYSIILIILASLSFYLIERPINKLKRFFKY